MDHADSIVVGGGAQGTLDFGAGPLPGPGLYVAKLDAAGNPVWAKRFGASAVVRDVAVDSTNAIVLTGDFAPPLNFGAGNLASPGLSPGYVAKLDKDGNHVFSKGFGTDVTFGWGVATDASNNVIIDGSSQGAVDFGSGPLVSPGGLEIYVAKFGVTGNPSWGKSFGGIHPQMGNTVAVDAMGAPIVGGEYYSVLDFGNGPLPDTLQGNGVFIAKLVP